MLFTMWACFKIMASGKDPRYHCTGAWVGPRAVLDTEVTVAECASNVGYK
jgi:hypothetical protein